MTGAVLPDGERGELVFTSLTKEATPVIRYRTRDLTRLLPGTARSMRRMEKVTGRSDDMLIVRGVNVFPTQIEELVLARPDLERALPDRAAPRRRGWTRCWSASRPGRTPSASPTLGAELARAIKERVGVSAEVEIVPPGGIERSLGKARRVIDRRPKES